MSESNRRQELERLHDELGRIETTDENRRQMIANARADIQRALARPTESPDVDDSLIGQLEEMVAHFEATHPDLTLTLNTVITSLSNMGL